VLVQNFPRVIVFRACNGSGNHLEGRVMFPLRNELLLFVAVVWIFLVL
jgi:hypothetical protein